MTIAEKREVKRKLKKEIADFLKIQNNLDALLPWGADIPDYCKV